MIKILHTSDWHLGQRLYGYDRREEQEAFLRQMAEIVREEAPDAMVVCGDVYHYANPSVAAQRMYNEAMIAMHEACREMTIVVTAGNHDSASKLAVNSMLWEPFGVRVIGGIAFGDDERVDFDRHVVEIKGKDGEAAGYICAVSYVYAQNYPLLEDGADGGHRQHDFFQALLDHIGRRNKDGKPVVMMAHLAVAGADTTGHSEMIGGMDYTEISQLGSGYDYLALGHLHRAQSIAGGKARYSGSPIAVSFDERYEHSVTIVEIEDGGAMRVRTIRIDNPMPLETIPEEPQPLEEALAALRALPNEMPGYIRLQVKTDGYLPAGSRERAMEALSGKATKFCLIKPVMERSGDAAFGGHELSVEEIRVKDPIDIARQYYMEQRGGEMDEETAGMLREAIERVRARMGN